MEDLVSLIVFVRLFLLALGGMGGTGAVRVSLRRGVAAGGPLGGAEDDHVGAEGPRTGRQCGISTSLGLNLRQRGREGEGDHNTLRYMYYVPTK